MRYGLRTLLILMAIGPPLLGGAWFGLRRYREWREALLWTEVGGPGAISEFSGVIGCYFGPSEAENADQPIECDELRGGPSAFDVFETNCRIDDSGCWQCEIIRRQDLSGED